MRKILSILSFAISCFLEAKAPIRQLEWDQSSVLGAVTYDFSGGRFGDNLLAYMHAKWLAFYYGIPLLYRPFPFSDQLMLHELEDVFYDQQIKLFKDVIVFKLDRELFIVEGPNKLVVISGVQSRFYKCGTMQNKKFGGSKREILISKQANVAGVFPFFPESPYKYDNYNWSYLAVNWKNENFKKELKKLIAPRKPTVELILPTDKITVAIHIRRGGSYERLNLGFPFKFPDDSYYIEQLKVLDELLKHKQLYVFLFSDDQEPLKILEEFQKQFKLFPHIYFDCRRTQNDHNINVLEDFFALTKFDCLIRSESNFSVCAAKISDYLVEIEPEMCKVINAKSIVSKANVIIDQEACHRKGVVID